MQDGKTLHKLRFIAAAGEGSRAGKGEAVRENGRQFRLENREGGGSPVFSRPNLLKLGP